MYLSIYSQCDICDWSIFLSLPPPSTQLPLVAVDSIYYGKIVCTPWNILLYNVFGKGGPNLYGRTLSTKWGCLLGFPAIMYYFTGHRFCITYCAFCCV